MSAVPQAVPLQERRSSLPQEIARCILAGFDRHYRLFRAAALIVASNSSGPGDRLFDHIGEALDGLGGLCCGGPHGKVSQLLRGWFNTC